MSDPTNVVARTYQRELRDANPASLPDVLHDLNLGHQLAVVQATFAALGSAAGHDITTAASKAAATVVGIDLDTGENLPAIGSVVTGTGYQAPHIVSDGSPIAPPGGDSPTAPGVATLSVDGKTITFAGAVTAFVITYIPRAAVALTDPYLGV